MLAKKGKNLAVEVLVEGFSVKARGVNADSWKVSLRGLRAWWQE